MRCEICGLENPSGMRFCGACGVALPGVPAAGPGRDASSSAHRRHVTVLCCDMVGSTRLAGTLELEDFREVLVGYQQACVGAIERVHGYTARYTGDGLIAYFGYPRAREDSAPSAVHAGLGILEALDTLNIELRAQRGVAVDVRIGIHTGTVLAGEMGGGATRETLGIVGDTPHLAAALESVAAPGTVVISDATRELVEEYFETEPLGERMVAGISRPLAVHQVVRATGAVGRLELGESRCSSRRR